MHGPIHNQLVNGCLATLNKLGKEIIDKRDEGMPQFGSVGMNICWHNLTLIHRERSFRIPVRVTYNDVKRTQFLSDLTNPSIPLARLMRNPIPHGFKGIELLDTMFAPSFGPSHIRNVSGTATPSAYGSKAFPEPIPIERALWFIRVLGCNEISAHRGRAQPVITTASASSPAAVATPASSLSQNATPTVTISSSDWHTSEFTNVFTSWLRVQLAQLSLPTSKLAVKPGVPVPRPITSVLSDETLRTRWLAKWDYSCKLLHSLHSFHLLSGRILSGWLVDQLTTTNLAQLGFVVRLLGNYLPTIAGYVDITRPCVRAACDRVVEVSPA